MRVREAEVASSQASWRTRIPPAVSRKNSVLTGQRLGFPAGAQESPGRASTYIGRQQHQRAKDYRLSSALPVMGTKRTGITLFSEKPRPFG